MLDITAILVSYNTLEMTRTSLNCLVVASQNLSIKIIVIDNASKDQSVNMLRNEYPNITLIENNKNVGFGRANNQALELINSKYVLLLNTDAFVKPDTLTKTLKYMSDHATCGILGVKLLGRDGEIQPSCRFFPTPWNIFLTRTGLSRIFKNTKLIDDINWDHAIVRNCDWVPGCYYLVRKEVIDQVGLFDPRYFLYYEEVDHCFSTKKAGWDITYFPDTSVVHIGGESAKSEGEITSSGRQIKSIQIESELLYFRKYYGLSGVLSHLLLNNLADILQSIKDILRFRAVSTILFNIKHSASIWSIFFRTKFASYSTR